MKKTLLFGAAVAIASTGAFAQKSVMEPVKAPSLKAVQQPVPLDNVEVPVDLRKPAPRTLSAKSGAIDKLTLGTSYNLYSVLTSPQQCAVANQDLGIVGMVHRQDAGRPGGSGVVQFSYTNDMVNVSDIRVTYEGSSNRYPSGALFNPAGNTDANNAYIHVAGPQTDAAGWANNFFATAKLDSTVFGNTEVPMADLDGYAGTPTLVRNYMTLTDDNVSRILYTTDDAVVYTDNFLMTGTWNATTNNYDYVAQSFYGDGMFPSTFEKTWVTCQAWSRDGQTGYLMIVTQDTTDANELRATPHLLKSTDAGNSYTLLPTFDFSTLEGLDQYLITGTGMDSPTPFFLTTYRWDAQVDINGNFHLAIGVGSAATNHPDSLNFLYGDRHIIDFFTTSTGGWDYRYVSEVVTTEVADDSGNAVEGIGWNHRVQCSATPDGSRIFVQWNETNPEFSDENAFPDVWAWGMRVTDGFVTDRVNFTENTFWDGNNYFQYFGDQVFADNGTYTLHVTTSTPNESRLATDPATHDLLTGIQFTDAQFHDPSIGIKEMNAANFGVSVYPNPATDATNLNINLDTPSNVTLKVSNTLGQTIEVRNLGTLAAGSNTIQLDVANMNAGIYFYSVSANNTTVTKRLIVK